ncbi:hypothetical protein SH591_12985 [Sphingomonas sp. LY54]|uniref:hypothetical protein n=1 Tax=Sphingomonadales TaxID=204457 RepID=UPI002ADEF5FF|nr:MULTISPECIES: hypothetical protein [Sphingomonadales]MEA1015647.1 hypothetical protein [Sphingosinicella sp. LY1275]WRP28011.1 hypothetical protein SH591_12985 [Sphingomonas sp. LY54]
MLSRQEVSSFIRTTFRSVWTLELLLFLKTESERSWSRAELVAALRGSDLIVSQGVDALMAAGLVVTDADGNARYTPATADLAKLVDQSEAAYSKSPDAVRRLIISSANGGITAFADAFRLRKD